MQLVRPSHKRPLPPEWTFPHSQRPPLTPLLYTWTELSAVQRQTALTLLRESERKRRRVRRRTIVLTVLLAVLLLAFVVLVLSHLMGVFP